jgi:hypothetical protein
MNSGKLMLVDGHVDTSTCTATSIVLDVATLQCALIDRASDADPNSE